MNDIEKMVEDNKNLVFYTIARYFPNYKTDEDVIQTGMIGLWYACQRGDGAAVDSRDGEVAG